MNRPFCLRLSWLLVASIALCHPVDAQFQILVAETPVGSNPPSAWQGIQRYSIASTGGAATQIAGIPASELSDPYGISTNAAGEVFVGNRHGNSSSSTVSRFVLNTVTGNYESNGTISGNNLFGSHGLNFSNTGELFVTNLNGPMSRFTFPGGVATPNGQMGSGTYRDVLFSGDGQWAYASDGQFSLQKFNLATGQFVSNQNVSGAAGLHSGNWLGVRSLHCGL